MIFEANVKSAFGMRMKKRTDIFGRPALCQYRGVGRGCGRLFRTTSSRTEETFKLKSVRTMKDQLLLTKVQQQGTT
jgi:hypothetical protein